MRTVHVPLISLLCLFFCEIDPGVFAKESASQSGQIIAQNKANRITNEQRKAAAARIAAVRQSSPVAEVLQMASPLGPSVVQAMAMPMPGGTPDYFGSPNWAFSPPLRKFVDTLPKLGPAGANNLGQYISVGVPDTTTYPGTDYYEIELRQFTEQMHSDLPPTTLRGYVQVQNGQDVAPIHYLGPLIVATKDRPVRIKFTNKLSTGSGGDLFIPVDTTVMGAGMGPLGMDAMPMNYTQNRATLHLHGGRTVWISDGTPHQWITPAGEMTPYPKGVSVTNVPDMPDPGEGSQTFFYSNQQSARLLFYHDHSWGITRLNVYVGEAAGYLITDPVEEELIASGVIPAEQIPLIIQDKSFVDAETVHMTDPTWNWGTGTPDVTGVRPPVTGDLWYPHVYSPAQNPADLSGMNAYGRWHYGPWFWPPTSGIPYGPVPNPYYDPVNAPWEPEQMPGVPHPSMPGESFMDTPVVNGTAFPRLEVQPKAYRFRILNAANDRFWNLQLYEADSIIVTSDNRTNTEVKMIAAIDHSSTDPTWPVDWPTDGREGGVPDWRTAGPEWIQIGTEGGFLPAPAIVANRPIAWNMDPTTFNFGNVSDHALLLGPAERADVIVDFSGHAGKTFILYNDAPAAFPALDARYDYYTGAPDLTDVGGHSGPPAGFGPNTRTIMQITVANTTPAAVFDLPRLQAAFASTPESPGAFARSQDPIIMPSAEYNSAYNGTFPADPYVRIFQTSKTFQTIAGNSVTIPFQPKAIQDEMGEAFDEYGRMSGKLGLELPGTNAQNQNFVLQNYVDPSTELLTDCVATGVATAGDGTQIWKITHNGVDTHPIHFHLFDVQLINRVGWDNGVRPPDANELGWKDTVRVSPLEDTIVALRPVASKQPFGVPDSIRPLNPMEPLGSTMGFTNIDPLTGQPLEPATVNQMVNFGWEYVWHCHILSHEEMDMMRPIMFNVVKALPAVPVLTPPATVEVPINLTWTDGTPASDSATLGNPANEIGFRIERAMGKTDPFAAIATALANATSFSDITALPGTEYRYRVVAYNAAGESASNIITAGVQTPPAAPTGLTATQQAATLVDLTWTDNALNETGFRIERAIVTNGTPGPFAGIGTVGANVTTFGDPTVSFGVTYAYQVFAFNSASDSPSSSNVVTITILPVPAAPTNLAAIIQTGPRVRLTFQDNANNETGFVVERSDNGGAYAPLAALPVQTRTGNVTFTDTSVAIGNTYAYRVKAMNGPASSAYSNVVTVEVPTVPAAPSNVTVTAVRNGNQDRVTVAWTDNANNETGFQVQRATNSAFTAGLSSSAVGANVTTFQQNVNRRTTYYYRVCAVNTISGSSAWVNATPLPITTP